MNVLTLKVMGDNIRPDDPEANISDIGYYRIGIYDNRIKGKDGRNYILDFWCCTHYKYRTTHKITGKELKKPIREIITPCGIHLDTEFEKLSKDGFMLSYRNSQLEQEVHEMHLSYTKENILKVINYIAAEKFDAIEIV